MQSQAYAQKVKISNLQQMANTIIYVQENGFDTQTELKGTLSAEKEKLSNIQDQMDTLSAEMKSLNEQIHFTGQYLSSKRFYTEFLKANNKKQFREEHASQIQSYEEARAKLNKINPDGNIISLKDLKKHKQVLQRQMNELKADLKYHKNICRELEIADANVSASLDAKAFKMHKSHDNELLKPHIELV